jgi:Pyridine nucleotide-disulphide oxidoreductase
MRANTYESKYRPGVAIPHPHLLNASQRAEGIAKDDPVDRRNFLIVGGGLAAESAVQAIREAGERGSILVLSDEADPPYNRPPLSKGLWRGQAVDTIWRPIDAAVAELRLGTKIVALDPIRKTATSTAGDVFGYDKLLLATGGSPRRLNGGDPLYGALVVKHRFRHTLPRSSPTLVTFRERTGRTSAFMARQAPLLGRAERSNPQSPKGRAGRREGLTAKARAER